MLTLKMRSILMIAATSAFMGCTFVGCSSSQKDSLAADNKQTKDSTTPQPTSLDINKLSEALGNFIGRNLITPENKFDLEAVIKGMRDGVNGKPSPMTDQEYEQAMTELQKQTLSSISAKNLDAANDYMKENASIQGLVEVVPGKLTYLILEEGKEPAVPEHGTPLINYTGRYIDGTIFGSSESTGGPITVPIDQTIPGFSKGIMGMKEGEKRRLFVHPEMGYGTSGQLPPNSMLIFDIEVVKATSPDKDLTDAFQSKMSEELDRGTDRERGLDFDEQDVPSQK